jgi:cyanate lyase
MPACRSEQIGPDFRWSVLSIVSGLRGARTISDENFQPKRPANADGMGFAFHCTNTSMTKLEMTEIIVAAKKAKKATWAAIAREAGLSEVYTASACLGENALDSEAAGKVTRFLGLEESVAGALTEFANKGEAAPSVPKEPLQYRFQEIIYVYGRTMKELIEEKFGAGIMSAIDFTMDIEKVPDPKGDRVKVTMNGKFLAYKKW